MAPYATYANMITLLGGQKLGKLYPEPGSAEAYFTLRLNAASEVMDGFFRRGGYTVPLDPTSLTDADQEARLSAKLQEVCVILALVEGTILGQDVTKAEREAYDRAMAWLRQVADGRAPLSLVADEPLFAGDELEDSVLTNDLWDAAAAYMGSPG